MKVFTYRTRYIPQVLNVLDHSGFKGLEWSQWLDMYVPCSVIVYGITANSIKY